MKKSELRQIIREAIHDLDTPQSGKDIAAKMRKQTLLRGFAAKVESMNDIDYKTLENMLPDYIPGNVIRLLFVN